MENTRERYIRCSIWFFELLVSLLRQQIQLFVSMKYSAENLTNNRIKKATAPRQSCGC